MGAWALEPRALRIAGSHLPVALCPSWSGNRPGGKPLLDVGRLSVLEVLSALCFEDFPLFGAEIAYISAQLPSEPRASMADPFLAASALGLEQGFPPGGLEGVS